MEQTRREFLKFLLEKGEEAIECFLSFQFFLSYYNVVKKPTKKFYQINTKKCIACGNCAKACIRKGTPAIQAINDLSKCGYCKRCAAYFLKPEIDSEERDNLVCPYNALKRKQIEEFRYLYTVDTKKCHGCGKCVILCRKNGQGSLSLYINQDLCLRCRTCSAMRVCPQKAISVKS